MAGHMTIVVGGAPCTCGRRGCLETYASAAALIRRSRELMEGNQTPLLQTLCRNAPEKIDGKLIFEALLAGDKGVEQIVKEYTNYLATGICNLIELYRPEKVLLGGGLSNAGECLISPLRNKVSSMLYGRKYLSLPLIEIAGLKNDAGIIGAAALLSRTHETGSIEGGTHETSI